MTEEKKTSEEQSEEKKTEDEKNTDDTKTVDNETTEEKEVTKEEGDKKDATSDDVCCDTSGEGNNIFVWLVVIVLVIGVVIFFTQRNSDDGEEKEVNDKISEEVSAAATKLIEEQLVAPGTKVTVGKITEDSGLYKIELDIEGQEVTSYMTKDKTKFIPQLIDTKEMEEVAGEGEEQVVAPVAEVTVKSDKPEVELFVMSHCPYGTQAEKGMLPVLDALGDNIDMQFKFVDYAMHGELEVKEQMRQYCIQKNNPNQFGDYLNCFLSGVSGSEEEAKACMTKLQINQAITTQCESALDKEHGILALLADKASWVSGQFPQFNIDKADNEKYGVQGSPTLVINGEQIQAGRDSASLLAAICSGFNEQPAACQTELSSVSPAPGFGTGVDESGASAEAGCGA